MPKLLLGKEFPDDDPVACLDGKLPVEGVLSVLSLHGGEQPEEEGPLCALGPVHADALARIGHRLKATARDEGLDVIDLLDDGRSAHEQGVGDLREGEIARVRDEQDGGADRPLLSGEVVRVESEREESRLDLGGIVGQGDLSPARVREGGKALRGEEGADLVQVVSDGPLGHARGCGKTRECHLVGAHELSDDRNAAAVHATALPFHSRRIPVIRTGPIHLRHLPLCTS